jgi:DNA-binding transcriptional LysR family regulator
MSLDPRLLQSFVVLSEELHFGRAAERLNLAQPALSQQIQRLELQVGCDLYSRSPRLVELTRSGRAMLPAARAALRAVDQAERAVREASRTTSHRLRVGVNPHVEEIVPAVAAYASTHPEVRLSISRMPELQGHEMTLAGVLDAFIGTYAVTAESDLARAASMAIPLYALVGAHHPMARGSTASLADYRKSTIAIVTREHEPGQFDYFVDLFSEGRGRSALSIHEFPSVGDDPQADVLSEITAGRAVGFGTQATLGPRASQLRMLPFDPPLSITAHASWHAQRSQVVDTFVNYLGTLAGPE